MVLVNHGAMPSKIDLSYCAGLFDGEGSVLIKKYFKHNGVRRYWTWTIAMEISMVDLDILQYFATTVGHNRLSFRKRRGLGKKDQWRWKATYRHAERVARLLLPYSKVKHAKILQVVQHYDNVKRLPRLANFPVRPDI